MIFRAADRISAYTDQKPANEVKYAGLSTGEYYPGAGDLIESKSLKKSDKLGKEKKDEAAGHCWE